MYGWFGLFCLFVCLVILSDIQDSLKALSLDHFWCCWGSKYGVRDLKWVNHMKFKSLTHSTISPTPSFPCKVNQVLLVF